MSAPLLEEETEEGEELCSAEEELSSEEEEEENTDEAKLEVSLEEAELWEGATCWEQEASSSAEARQRKGVGRFIP